MTTKKSIKTKKSFDYTTIKTFEDACKKLGEDPNITPISQHIPKEYKKPIIAFYKLIVIFKAINNGWKPDWSNYDQGKYYPWFGVLSSGFGFSYSYCDCGDAVTYVGSLLCTNTSEKARYMAEQFKELYQDYLLYSE